MTIIAATVGMPHPGKRPLAESRFRQVAGVLARHGASVKLATTTSGPRTGSIILLRSYPDFRAAAAAFKAVNNDPAYAEFQQERESNPAADMLVTRDILRAVYGEGRWDTHPVSLLRRYDVTRDKLEGALGILPEVSEIVSEADVNVTALVPVTGENLSSMIVAYQFRSLEHWGEALDSVGSSDGFQAIVSKASQFGTLRSASTSIPL